MAVFCPSAWSVRGAAAVTLGSVPGRAVPPGQHVTGELPLTLPHFPITHQLWNIYLPPPGEFTEANEIMLPRPNLLTKATNYQQSISG